MKRFFVVLLLSSTLILINPVHAYACGFIEFDCIFGFSERTQIRADRDVDTARLNAERDRQVAEAQAEAEQKKREADALVERAKNERYATQTQADIAIANAQAQRDITIKVIDSWLMERVSAIDSQQAVAVAGIQGQADIAIEGIRQAGETERTRENNGRVVTGIIILVSLLGSLAVAYMRHQKQMYLLQNPHVWQARLEAQHQQISQQPAASWEIMSETKESQHYDR